MLIPSYSSTDEVYRYDPIADSWTQMDDFPGGARYSHTAFVIDNIPYVGTGVSSYFDPSPEKYRDLWRYNEGADTWTQMADMPISADKRDTAYGFSIGGYGYISAGMSDSDECLDDTWRYDPSTDSWTQVDDFPVKTSRYNATVPSVLEGKCYCLSAYNGFSIVYVFDPITGWSSAGDGYPGPGEYGESLTIESRLFIGLGSWPYNYWWEYEPGVVPEGAIAGDHKHGLYNAEDYGTAREAATAQSINDNIVAGHTYSESGGGDID